MKEFKICLFCKKPFSNRKKWSSRDQFDTVKYCSNKCRNNSKKNKNAKK